jgi:hypothetical protein
MFNSAFPAGEISGSNPMDVNVSVSARNYLRQYLHMIKIPNKIKGASSIWPTADDSEMEFFQSVVEKMIWFSQVRALWLYRPTVPLLLLELHYLPY